MSLPVLVVGLLRPDLGRRTTHLGVPVADLRHDDAVLEAAADLDAPDEPLVLLAEHRSQRAARRAQVLASVALPRTPVVLRTPSATPLGVWAAADALVREPVDAGTGLALLDELLRRLWSGVWTPSVRRLEDPAPSLAQHARSLLPGGGFLAEPGRGVRPAGGSLEALEVVTAPDGPRVLRHTPVTDPRLSWLVGEAQRVTRADTVEPVASWQDPLDAYGTATAVELALLPTAGARAAAERDLQPCDGCRRRRAAGTCGFCGMTTGPVPAPVLEAS